MPRLTVLLPARNARKYIVESLKSTLRSLPSDSEVLVIDDGSEDDTASRADAVSDTRVRIIRKDEPHGLSNALNYGLAESDSEIVSRMDADDVCLPWRFRSQLASLATGTDIAFGGAIYISPTGQFRRPTLSASVSHNVDLLLLLGNSLIHPTMTARRETVESVNGYRDVRAEDFDLWLRLAHSAASIRVATAPMVLYRRHEHQTSSSASWANAMDSEIRGGLLLDSYVALHQTCLPPLESYINVVRSVTRISPTSDALTLIAQIREELRGRSTTLAERLLFHRRLAGLESYVRGAGKSHE